MEHGSRAHATFSASAMHRIARCPGSVRRAALAPPETESKYAKDGTEAHELLDFALKGEYTSAREAYIMMEPSWDINPNDLVERIAAVDLALDYVYNLLDAHEDAVLLTEQYFKFPSNITDDAGGHCDILVLVPSLSLIYVIDYKHGAGVAVEVVEADGKENEQLLTYGTGGEQVTGWGYDTVVLVIIQPRAFHPMGRIREHVVSKQRLVDFIDQFDDYVIAALDNDAPLVPGEKQCQWCPDRVFCPAREAKALASLPGNFASVKMLPQVAMPDPRTMQADQLAYIISAADFVKDWFKDAESYALELARAGVYIPGFKLAHAQARRKWEGDDNVIADKLAKMADLDRQLVMPPKLIGITEAEKLVVDGFKARAEKGKLKQAAEEARAAMALLTTKDTSGNTVLVHESDKRPAVNAVGANFASVKLV